MQVKEPYGNLDMVNYLYKVHLPIILASKGLAVYRERKKKRAKQVKEKSN